MSTEDTVAGETTDDTRVATAHDAAGEGAGAPAVPNRVFTAVTLSPLRRTPFLVTASLPGRAMAGQL
jgi:hypothetical protein